MHKWLTWELKSHPASHNLSDLRVCLEHSLIRAHHRPPQCEVGPGWSGRIDDGHVSSCLPCPLVRAPSRSSFYSSCATHGCRVCTSWFALFTSPLRSFIFTCNPYRCRLFLGWVVVCSSSFSPVPLSFRPYIPSDSSFIFHSSLITPHQ